MRLDFIYKNLCLQLVLILLTYYFILIIIAVIGAGVSAAGVKHGYIILVKVDCASVAVGFVIVVVVGTAFALCYSLVCHGWSLLSAEFRKIFYSYPELIIIIILYLIIFGNSLAELFVNDILIYFMIVSITVIF